jgi:hypothetical protein
MDDFIEDDLIEEPVEEEVSQGELAREAVDDWAYMVGALRLNRQA